MKESEIPQGPWTRLRPLQRDELDVATRAGMAIGEITWGNFRNNLCKVMAYVPRIMQTEIEYSNGFIFDPPTFRGRVQEAGFNDRFIKELVISKTALINRSRDSITHHAYIGIQTYAAAGRKEEAHQKYLYLHEHEKHCDVYTERENVVLDYTAKVVKDAHLVTDGEFTEVRRVLREHNMLDERLSKLENCEMERHVDAQVVELTWLIGHYCSLSRWFTVLQVPDEVAVDEDDFTAWYEDAVPEDIRQRNAEILGDDF